MSKTPRTPAAFINALAEEGSREELIEWLQRTWDERCQYERENADLIHDIKRYVQMNGVLVEDAFKAEQRADSAEFYRDDLLAAAKATKELIAAEDAFALESGVPLADGVSEAVEIARSAIIKVGMESLRP